MLFFDNIKVYSHFLSTALRFSFDLETRFCDSAANARQTGTEQSKPALETSSFGPNILRFNKDCSIISFFQRITEHVRNLVPDRNELCLPGITKRMFTKRIWQDYEHLCDLEPLSFCYFLRTWK